MADFFKKGIYYHGSPIGSPLLSPHGILHDTGVPAGYTFITVVLIKLLEFAGGALLERKSLGP